MSELAAERSGANGHWTVIVNPAAGRSRRRTQVPDVLAAIDAMAHANRVPIEAYVSTSADDAIAHAAKAAANGRDLVAAGGDGTVGAIAGVAADHGARLAIVPCGSGNDFATYLGYDVDTPTDALAVLGDGGVDRTIDLGRVNDRWYCTITATGFDSEANRWANGVTRLSGTPLYVAAVLRTLALYKPHPLRVTVDGASHELKAWMVSVGNSTTYGGGMRITPDALIDDGRVDVCVIDGAVPRWKFLAQFPKVFKGTHTTVKGVRIWRASNVTVESLDGSVPIEVFADGERVGPLPATMRAVPNALTVRVPAT